MSTQLPHMVANVGEILDVEDEDAVLRLAMVLEEERHAVGHGQAGEPVPGDERRPGAQVHVVAAVAAREQVAGVVAEQGRRRDPRRDEQRQIPQDDRQPVGRDVEAAHELLVLGVVVRLALSHDEHDGAGAAEAQPEDDDERRRERVHRRRDRPVVARRARPRPAGSRSARRTRR